MRDILEIVRDLKDNEWQTRRAAVRELHQGGDERAIPLFVRMLGDAQPAVRRAAAEALADMGDWQAVEALMDSLEDRDAYVRYYAVLALGRMGYAETVPLLVKRLRDPFPFVRGKSAWALGELADKQAIQPLIRMLQKDSFLENQREAALALGKLGAEEQLLEMAHGRDPFARTYAEEVLCLLADVSGREPALVETRSAIRPPEEEDLSGREPAAGPLPPAQDGELPDGDISGREPTRGLPESEEDRADPPI